VFEFKLEFELKLRVCIIDRSNWQHLQIVSNVSEITAKTFHICWPVCGWAVATFCPVHPLHHFATHCY